MTLRIKRRPIPEVPLPDDIPPLLRRIYAARGIRDADELELGLDRLPGFESLAGIGAAAALLHETLEGDRRILVVGDFDTDGATATALAVHALRALGGTHVDYLVPDRARHGYGLSPAIVEVALERKPDLIVTVDNGIASVAGTAAAQEAGCRVLITDHHLPPEELPPADAIVNPNCDGCDFPCKALAGVGVLFYVLLGLRARLREAGWFESHPEPNLADYLDLVAMGTVADVVPLDQTNRILVAQGLKRIRAGRARPGIYALADAAGRDWTRLTAGDIGFGLAPRLNAAGRLENMGLGVDCLLAADIDAARSAALELESLNAERKERQTQMQDAALAALDGSLPGGRELPPGLCLYEKGWHEGIVGLVAGRVRERHHRPVVAFAAAGTGGLKGSARSIPGVHIRDVLENLAIRHPGLIERFGGHAMAAGLTLAADRLDDFRTAFAEEVARWVTPEMLEGVLLTDGEIAEDDFRLETAYSLREGGPWGAGFPEPVFEGDFEVLDQRIVGERHLKLRLCPAGGRRGLDGIAFQRDEPVPERVRAAYRLDVNRYQGIDSLQLIVEHIQT